VWTEVQSGDGAVNFITGMGGFLQGVIFGYGGMRLGVEELDFNAPRLPPNTTSIIFRNLNYIEMEFDLEVTATDVSINVTAMGRIALNLILTDPLEILALSLGKIYYNGIIE